VIIILLFCVYKESLCVKTPVPQMPLASVTDVILYHLDSFWGNLTLNELGMLMSISKRFQAVFFEVTARTHGKKKSLVTATAMEHALLAMIRCRPNDNNNWLMSISTAKYSFSLPVGVMLRHCMALPAGNPCRVKLVKKPYLGVDRWPVQETIARINSGGFPANIHFIDAFRLAFNMPGGIKAAMGCRHLYDASVQASSQALVEMVGDRYELIEEYYRRAADELSLKLQHNPTIRCKTRILRQIPLLIRSAGKAFFASTRMELTLDAIKDGYKPHSFKARVRKCILMFKRIAARYRNLSKICPGVMVPIHA